MMYVSVRDAVLKEAGYGSIAEGLGDLKLDSVELEFYRDYSVFPADSWERINFPAREAAKAIESSFSAGGGQDMCVSPA